MEGLFIKIKRLMKHTPWMSQKGATAVELGIVCFLLILLIFGMIEFSLYLFNRHVITNAAREGARYGVVSRPDRRTNSQIQNVVLYYSQQNLVTFDTDTPNVSIDPVDNDLSDGLEAGYRCVVFKYDFGGSTHRCDLKVQVDYMYHFLFLKTIGIDTMPIHSVATMKME
jgi:hypothetical protein